MKCIILFIIVLLLAQSAYSISLKELIERYIFSASTPQISILNHTDFMIDKNNNGLNDTLIFELETNNTDGSFIFVVSLFDKGSILLNESNKTLNKGINKLNLSLNSAFLSQNEFNYSIKIYNSSYSLKYRKDKIPTRQYSNYEKGFSILNIKDLKANKSLRINITIDSSIDGIFEAVLFLFYNNSIMSFKDNKSIAGTTQILAFDIDNETIKRTHYMGSYNLSLKIGKKLLKTNFTTEFYDFRDFADTSYIFGFTDSGNDINNNNKYDMLQINATVISAEENNYTLVLALYDESDNIVEIKNISSLLTARKNNIPFSFNGTRIYNKKLNGHFNIKYAELFRNRTLIDKINDAYTTRDYNFNDFESPSLPDLRVNIAISDGYHYGINNVTINFTFENIGSKPAFNIFYEIFDNYTFFKINKSNILDTNGKILYQISFTNISDFDILALIDSLDFVEELNESNNADKIIIKLNKKPALSPISDIISNESDTIIINLSATDPNNDRLHFSINLTKFSNNSNNSNIFQWDTTTTDSGNYTLAATASDGYLTDSTIFKITILDMPEKDIDNDGINDTADNVIGNEKSINTSTINLTILLDDSSNLSKFFNKSTKIKIMERDLTILEVDMDLSSYKLNLTNLIIDRQLGNSTGSLLVRGLKMSADATKTIYLDKINDTLNGICIKDEEISEIGEISSDCSSNNEFKIECDNSLQYSYKCAYNSTLSKYKIQGLKHSGVVQIPYTKPPSASGTTSTSTTSSSRGSSGGGGVICTSNWKCSEWSECINGFKNRNCLDISQCAFQTNKPIEKQQCITNELKEESASNGNIVRIVVPIGFRDGKTNKIMVQNASKNLEKISGRVMKSNLKVSAPYYGVVIFSLLLLLIIFYFITNTFINKI